ncbi:MAG: helix-turn-helix domain-containing protein [Spirochaetia bacterium]|nr:helix-turn-helix domain-containing protein [Spirochaetia bacterium]
MLAHVAYYFSGLFFINSLIQFYLFYKRKSKQNLFIFLILIIAGFGHLYGGLFFEKSILNFPFLFGIIAPIEAAGIASIYFAALYIVDEKRIWQKIDNFYFLPVVFTALLLIPLNQLTSDEKIRLINYAISNQMLEHLINDFPVKLLGIFNLLVCLLALNIFIKKIDWKKIVKAKVKTSIFRERIFFMIILAIVIGGFWLTYFYFRATNRSIFASTLLIYEVALLFFIILIAQLVPLMVKHKILRCTFETNAIKTYKKSRLEKINMPLLEKNLFNLIKNKKIFRNEALTLPDFAKMLSVTRSQLSEYINGTQKKSFRDFVNYHRIEDAKNLILTSDYKIIDIAYMTGFNSISSFNIAFRRHTGTNPLEFKNQKKQKETISLRHS